MLRAAFDNVKNLPGWRTRRKLVVFAVDDYANVRLASPIARDRLTAAGVPLSGRFDHLDTLETRADLEALFEVLASVKDHHGKPAIFTPYALAANPDFEAMTGTPTDYRLEPVTTTFARRAAEDPNAYEGAWALWQQGMRSNLLAPQFHGREHLNVALIEKKLQRHDADLRANFENRSVVGLTEEPTMPGVGFTHAFGFVDRADIIRHREIIAEGLRLFEQVYGLRSVTFTPPAQELHPALYPALEELGVQAIHKPFYTLRRIEAGRTIREVNFLGRRKGQKHVNIVRNVVFEPTGSQSRDSVALALRQVAAAFRWGKPAIISSHRVNFCGHIDPANRRAGLQALKQLLQAIVRRWPDVEFIGAGDLAQRIDTTS